MKFFHFTIQIKFFQIHLNENSISVANYLEYKEIIKPAMFSILIYFYII